MPPDSRFPALVSIACHDLRAPLAVVYGFASTLARADLEPPADRYVEMIGAASEQLDELLGGGVDQPQVARDLLGLEGLVPGERLREPVHCGQWSAEVVARERDQTGKVGGHGGASVTT